MGQLYAYEPWPVAVDTNGLCGPLAATKATCTQEKNGDFRLDIEHPIDPAGKWKKLVRGNLIKADVPLRTLPGIREGYSTTDVKHGYVAATTREARSVWTKQFSGGMRLAVLPIGTEVYETYRDTRSWIHWPGGSGWIDTASLSSLAVVPGPTALVAEMNSMVPPVKARPQLFRIRSVKPSDKGLSVVARHVFYDHAENLISVDAPDVNRAYALQQILAAANNRYLLPGAAIRLLALNAVSANDPTDVEAWQDISPVEAIMSPSNGVLSVWPGELLRDNWAAAVVDEAGIDAGYRIEYGRNMTGVSYEEDESGVMSRLVPVGQTAKGKPLKVPTGTYDVYGHAVSVIDGVVIGPNDALYVIPHIGKLDKGSVIKAASTTAGDVLAARVKLIYAAQLEFLNTKCDLPSLSLTVQFIHLGDTEEFAQYRNLQNVYLYDTVRVKHGALGIEVTAKVNKTVWNCLSGRYDSVELGTPKKNYARSRLAEWNVPGLASLKSRVDTISSLI